MIAQHLLGTGNGSCLADRWPAPRALLVETGGNWTLAGDPAALDPAAVAGRVAGFVEAPAAFEPLLRAAARELHEWPRVIFTLEAPGDPPPRAPRRRRGAPARARRRRVAGRAGLRDGLDRQHLGRPRGAGRQRHRLGRVLRAAAGRRACPFFVGEAYEDLGVATEPGFRGLGLSTGLRRRRLPGRAGPGPRPELDDLARQHRQPARRRQARLPAAAPRPAAGRRRPHPRAGRAPPQP